MAAALEGENSEAGCSFRVFKVEKCWEGARGRGGGRGLRKERWLFPRVRARSGAPRWTGGWDESINPFLPVPRPPHPRPVRACPPGPRPHPRVEASIPAGGGPGARPWRSRGVRGGRGPGTGITILIALMPFLEGEGLEDPSPLSTKMFNHCVESNQILSFRKKKNPPPNLVQCDSRGLIKGFFHWVKTGSC